MHAHLQQRLDSIAIMKCLGARSSQIMRIYVIQTLVLGLIGGMLGILVGLAVQARLSIADRASISTAAWSAARLDSGRAGHWHRPAGDVAVHRAAAAEHPPHPPGPDFPARNGRVEADLARALTAIGGPRCRGRRTVDRARRDRRFADSAPPREASAHRRLFRRRAGGEPGCAHRIAWVLLRLLRLVQPAHRLRLPAAVRHGIANLYRPGNHAEAMLVALGIGVMFTLTFTWSSAA